MKFKFLSVITAIIFLQLQTLAIDIDKQLRYDITAMLNMSKFELSVQAHITIPSSALADADKIYLGTMSAGEDKEGNPLLKIKQITSDEGKKLSYNIKGTSDTLMVTLQNVVKNSASVSIIVSYTISLLNDGASWKKSFEYFIFPSTAYGDCWYPLVLAPNKEILRFSDFNVSLTYPAEDVAILTTGKLEKEPQRSGEYLYANFTAHHVEGFAMNIGKGYVTEQIVQDGFQIITFSTQELAAAYHQAAELTIDAVNWYKSVYGFFPVDQIGIAAGSTRWSGGYPTSNLFYIHQGNLKPEFIRWITSHELGHYYWGLYVLSTGELNLNWLMLANGIWIDQYYIAHTHNRTLEEQWRSLGSGNWYVDFIQAMVSNYEQRLGITEKEANALNFDYNSLVRHAKGAVGMFLVSRRYGFERFLDLQRRILTEYKYKPPPLEEFINFFESTEKQDISRFFQQWQRGDASIGINIAKIENQSTNDTLHYSITVERTGTVQYPVLLEVEDATGRINKHMLEGEEEKEIVTGVMINSLSQIRLDPEGVLPMWNSSHPGIQRIYLIALSRAGLTQPFLILAKQYLYSNPKDEEIKRLLSQKQWKQ